jgi:hypothetical protein
MPIHGLGGANDLLGQGAGNGNGFSDDSADAEWLIYEFLIRHFKLTERHARQTIVCLIDAGENLIVLVQGIESCDDTVSSQIELHIPF